MGRRIDGSRLLPSGELFAKMGYFLLQLGGALRVRVIGWGRCLERSRGLLPHRKLLAQTGHLPLKLGGTLRRRIGYRSRPGSGRPIIGQIATSRTPHRRTLISRPLCKRLISGRAIEQRVPLVTGLPQIDGRLPIEREA
jgi:hypothetical protein